jgi:membrane protein required for beta-lactamase induction
MTAGGAVMGVVTAIIVIIVSLYVGLNIFDNIDSATNLAVDSPFNETHLDLIETTQDSYSMAGILPIVLIAGAVLAIIMGVFVTR